MAVYRRIDYDEKTGTSMQRIHARVRQLEKAALATRTVAMIQHCKVSCHSLLVHTTSVTLPLSLGGSDAIN